MNAIRRRALVAIASAAGLCIASAAARPAGTQPGTPPTPAPSQPDSKPAAKRTARVVELSGGIDCGKVLADLTKAIHDAETAGDTHLVLKFEGLLEWRTDAVRDAILLIAQSKVPVVAYQPSTGGDRISTGQLMLGLATTAYLVEGTPKIVDDYPHEDRDTAVGKTDWPAIETDLKGLLTKALERRGAPKQVADVLVSPAARWWVVKTADGAQLVTNDVAPKPLAGQKLIELATPTKGKDSGPGHFDLAISYEAMLACKLIDPSSPGAWLAKLGVQKENLTTVQVIGGVAAVKSQIHSQLQPRLEERIRAIGQELMRVPKKNDGSISADRYHTAARAAQAALDDATTIVDKMEKLCADYPEVMQTAPPGLSALTKPTTYPARWRTYIQTRRDSLARHKVTIDDYAKR